MTKVKDKREENHEQQEQSHESQGIEEKQVNSFWDITYGGEEEEAKEIHQSQNIVNTRISRKNNSSNAPNTSKPPTTTTSNTKKTSSSTNLNSPKLSKTTPSNEKDNYQTPKPSDPSISPKQLEYYFLEYLEYLKKTKSNISLFKLLKLPQIQENIIKNRCWIVFPLE